MIGVTVTIIITDLDLDLDKLEIFLRKPWHLYVFLSKTGLLYHRIHYSFSKTINYLDLALPGNAKLNSVCYKIIAERTFFGKEHRCAYVIASQW